MSSVAVEIRNKINSTPIVVYSKTWCPYCSDAKRALNEVGAKYEVIELNSIAGGEEIQAALLTITGIRTVPQVFIGGKCIGGGTDTVKLKNNGELKKMAEAAGAV